MMADNSAQVRHLAAQITAMRDELDRARQLLDTACARLSDMDGIAARLSGGTVPDGDPDIKVNTRPRRLPG
jgi:hypothetical protein